MSSSNAQDDQVWADFDNLRHGVKSNTVDKLKQIIAGLIEENSAPLSKTGKKQELIDRITNELDKYRYQRKTDQWARARAVLYQVRTSGLYTSSGATQNFTANNNFALNNVHGSAYAPPRAPSSSLHASSSVIANAIGRYDPYAPPRRPYPGSIATSSVKPLPPTSVPIRFKSSPFYRVEQAVSPVVECPESTGSMDRRNQTLLFSLSQENINKLSSPGSKFQLRLYCTTSTFYTPSPSGFRSNTALCPIEFPATCEVRVNNTPLQANLKGIKKKPGTAPPADLSKVVRMAVGHQNRIEMIYVNSQANTPPKKFYLTVLLVETSSVEQLVDRLRKGKFRSSDEIRSQMVKAADEDDDIIVGKQKMTLKCPLSYTRITIPCRSAKCVHPQCFDAISWYSVMEQTTTWLCPVCEKMLNPEELIEDGYFREILQQTPDSVEEVEVEPNGEWHTGDNKFGSKAWMEVHRSKQAVYSPQTRTCDQTVSSTPVKRESCAPGVQSLGEVVVLDSDSDNEDETRVKRELSPDTSPSFSMDARRNGPRPVPTKRASSTVIDLTLDSEDEDAPPLRTTPVTGPKRKASEAVDRPGDVAYKKSRVSDLLIPPAEAEKLGAGYPDGPSSAPPVPGIHRHSSYTGLSLPSRASSSSANGYHHNSPSSVTSPPAVYYSTLPHLPAQNSRPFIHYNGPYQHPTTVNGSGVPYNGTTVDPARQGATSYNAYLSQSSGVGGSGWP